MILFHRRGTLLDICRLIIEIDKERQSENGTILLVKMGSFDRPVGKNDGKMGSLHFSFILSVYDFVYQFQKSARCTAMLKAKLMRLLFERNIFS